jgi:hypothetical protein
MFMRIMTPVFTGMALAIAGIMTFSMADTALAKTKKQEQSQPQVQSSEVHSGADRQLQGRFYKRHKTHKQTKKQEQSQPQVQSSEVQVQSSEVRSGADRQLQGRFYKRHKTHKAHTENK